MKNLWNDREASAFPGDLALRVYTSRLLVRDAALVLHGDGSTSVKIRGKNLFGEDEDIFYVKGSGWDLETSQTTGFPPCWMPHWLQLSKLKPLSDPQMADQLHGCKKKPCVQAPSAEAILRPKHLSGKPPRTKSSPIRKYSGPRTWPDTHKSNQP